MVRSSHSLLTVETIIDTAEKLIVETDARDYTLRALSRALGCAPGALNQFFPGGVDEIISAVQAVNPFACMAGSPTRTTIRIIPAWPISNG